jgi:hypothetical protein
LGGKDGCCEYCVRNKPARKKLKRLPCLCGKVAIVVVLATVLTPQEEPMDVEVPLCRLCWDLERELELEVELSTPKGLSRHAANPIQIIVVKNLPRSKRPLSARKF